MRLLAYLFVLFIILPFVELYLLLKLGQATSPEVALAVVVGTGILGGFLARRQGLGVLRKMRSNLIAGRLPAGDLFDGVLVLIGGILLIAPGMITDAIGLLLLIPCTRKIAKSLIRKRIEARFVAAAPRRHVDVEFEVKQKDDARDEDERK